MNACFVLDALTRSVLRLLDVLRAHVDTFDDDAILVFKSAQDCTLLALIFAADADDGITRMNLHRTSGAWEIIF